MINRLSSQGLFIFSFIQLSVYRYEGLAHVDSQRKKKTAEQN